MISFLSKPRKSPVDASTMHYAIIAPIQPLTFEQICENITEVCTVTRHDVKCVISALQSEILKACQNGQSVRLGDLGSFRPTIQGSGSATAEEVKSGSISNIRCRFVAGSLIHRRLDLKNPEVKFHLSRIPVAKAAASEGSTI